MSSNMPKDDLWPGDTSSSESATPVPNSPKIASQKKPDKKEGALVIPAKTTVGENPKFNIKASMQKRVALQKPKNNWAPLGSEMIRSAKPDEKQKKTRKSRHQKRYYAPFMGYKFIAYLCP